MKKPPRKANPGDMVKIGTQYWVVQCVLIRCVPGTRHLVCFRNGTRCTFDEARVEAVVG